MAMHAMPTIAEAANEKIVRYDMFTVLPGLPKKPIPPVAGLENELRQEPQPAAERCALCQCLVDLDQLRHLGTARIRTIHGSV
jgi:hypothetical protein